MYQICHFLTLKNQKNVCGVNNLKTNKPHMTPSLKSIPEINLLPFTTETYLNRRRKVQGEQKRGKWFS
jgi:hypothetical protein